jgi:hypothetical protein
MDSIGVQDSDLSRNCGIGMTPLLKLFGEKAITR